MQLPVALDASQAFVEATDANTNNAVARRASDGSIAFGATTVTRLIAGSLSGGIVTKTSGYTATINDGTILCDATSAAFSVGLPAAATCAGLTLCIKKIDASANAVTIDPSGAELIDGAATKSLASQWNSALIQSNGTAWYVLAS